MSTPPETRPHLPLRLLLVEDSELDAQLVVSELEQGGYEVTFERVESAAGLEAALGRQAWDLVLSDHNMPQFNSTAALGIVRERTPEVPFIIVSGSIGEELAVAAMREGASDYILKDNLRRLVPAIERELREAVDRRERRRAEHALLAQEEQQRIARVIQQRMFPVAAPEVPGWTIAGASLPADATGGDYYDYMSVPAGWCWPWGMSAATGWAPRC
jgi:DNA-binding NtrC family response regulator